MSQNLADRIASETGNCYEFPASLTISDEQSVNVTVKIDDQGLALTTKKDNIFFSRSQWLDVAVVSNVLALTVYGIGYESWAKKRKFEKSNPDSEFTDFFASPQSYVLVFKPRKLPDGVTAASISIQASRTYQLAYMDEVADPIIVECGDCKTLIDASGYSPDDSLFCDNCNKVIGEDDNESNNHGICDSCGYYTKLVNVEKSELGDGGSITIASNCHRCRVRQTIRGFFVAVASAVGIGVLNFVTIYFLDRYFPVLLFIGIGALLWSGFKLVMVILHTLARKATGESPLEKATDALRRGNADQAVELINAMEGDMTENPGILMNLSRGLTNAGDFEKAGQFADILTDSFPNFLAGHQAKLEVLAAQNADEEKLVQLVDTIYEISSKNALRSLRRQKLLLNEI